MPLPTDKVSNVYEAPGAAKVPEKIKTKHGETYEIVPSRWIEGKYEVRRVKGVDRGGLKGPVENLLGALRATYSRRAGYTVSAASAQLLAFLVKRDWSGNDGYFRAGKEPTFGPNPAKTFFTRAEVMKWMKGGPEPVLKPAPPVNGGVDEIGDLDRHYARWHASAEMDNMNAVVRLPMQGETHVYTFRDSDDGTGKYRFFFEGSRKMAKESTNGVTDLDALAEAAKEGTGSAERLAKFCATNPKMKDAYLSGVVRPVRLWKRKGKYDATLAPKLPTKLVLAGAKMLGGSGWMEKFPPAVRDAANKHVLRYANKDAAAGKVDNTLPKVHRPGFSGYDKAD